MWTMANTAAMYIHNPQDTPSVNETGAICVSELTWQLTVTV